MKNDFRNDVDNENIEIAGKLFEDSKCFQDENVSVPSLDNILEKDTSSKRTFKKSHIFSLASVVAACIIILIGVKTIPIFDLENSAEKNSVHSTNKTSVSDSSDYTKIYKTLENIALSKTGNNMYDEFEDVEFSALTEDVNANASFGTINQSKTDGNITTGFDSDTEKSFYNTNEQTQNVHEADIVKTDGNYIYTLKSDDKDKIIITKVDGMNMKVVKKLSFDNDTSTDISELYLLEDKLVAIGSKWNEKDSLYTTLIYVFDIKKPENASLVKCITQDGSYTSSRMVDNYLYTISEKNLDANYFKTCDHAPSYKEIGCYVPMVDCYPMNPKDICIPDNPDNLSYTVITSLDVTAPSKFITSKSVLGGSSEIYVSQNNIYILNYTYEKVDISNTKLGKDAATCYPIYDNQLIDFDNPSKTPLKIEPKDSSFYEPFHNLTEYSYGIGDIKSQVENFLEMMDSDYSLDDIKAYISTDVYKATTITEITKYKYDEGKVEFVASNQINGHTENNLNYDEKDGYLRCVTTENSTSNLDMIVKCYDKKDTLLYNFVVESNNLDNTSDTNNVFVLDEKLEITAEINDLAEGESIYSARYFGNYGYFVTYEETDPLFSVDFSDMENPMIIGELKMPGVSEYLHFYKDNLLFGLGYEDTNESRFLKLEMYDVSTGIAQKKTKTLLKQFCFSEALYEYKAIMVDPERNIIGFHAEEDYNEKDDNYPNYYVVYSYENNNFKELLKIKINDVTSQVRGFYIDDYLYIVTLDWETLSNDNITVVNIKTYNKDKKIERLKLK